MTVRSTNVSLLAVGSFPPPVTGQSVANDSVVDFLSANGLQVGKVDTGEGAYAGDVRGRVRRVFAFIRSCWRIACDPVDFVYISVNANKGILLTAIQCLLARLSGKRLSLHHHAFSYIASPNRFSRLMFYCAGESAMHFAVCEYMIARIKSRYPNVVRALPFNNVGVVAPKNAAKLPSQGLLVLGHLSNLTEEKGIGRAVDLLRTILNQLDAKLVVAGPCSDGFARQTVKDAEAEFGPRFEYRGAVFASEKDRFFSELDVFLFPSLYKNETQGIVLLEALAHGVPVIAFSQCCIAGDISGAGAVVERESDFAAEARKYLEVYQSNRSSARLRAHSRFGELQDQHAEERASMLAYFRS